MRVRTLLNPFKCLQRYEKKPWDTVFPTFNGQIDVEIGFGTGSFARQYALNNPGRNLVAFEIRKKLVTLAQERLATEGITNAHLLWGNGHYGLEDMFDDGSIDRLFIFHPDPWPKMRQIRRRLINEAFLTLAAKKLKVGGRLFLATDVPALWEYMQKVLTAVPTLVSCQDDLFWQTEYQTRWKEMSLEQNRSLFYGTFERR